MEEGFPCLNGESLTYKGVLVADFDNYVVAGVYQYSGAEMQNSPPGAYSAGNLIVTNSDRYVIQQLITPVGMYTRRKSSTWGAWISYATK